MRSTAPIYCQKCPGAPACDGKIGRWSTGYLRAAERVRSLGPKAISAKYWQEWTRWTTWTRRFSDTP